MSDDLRQLLECITRHFEVEHRFELQSRRSTGKGVVT